MDERPQAYAPHPGRSAALCVFFGLVLLCWGLSLAFLWGAGTDEVQKDDGAGALALIFLGISGCGTIWLAILCHGVITGQVDDDDFLADPAFRKPIEEPHAAPTPET